MSYQALTQALIDKQQDVLGDQAVEIAENVSGIELDGTEVVQVNGGDAVEALVGRFEDKMGQAALTALRIVAKDYSSDVELPPSLEL